MGTGRSSAGVILRRERKDRRSWIADGRGQRPRPDLGGGIQRGSEVLRVSVVSGFVAHSVEMIWKLDYTGGWTEPGVGYDVFFRAARHRRLRYAASAEKRTR